MYASFSVNRLMHTKYIDFVGRVSVDHYSSGRYAICGSIMDNGLRCMDDSRRTDALQTNVSYHTSQVITLLEWYQHLT